MTEKITRRGFLEIILGASLAGYCTLNTDAVPEQQDDLAKFASALYANIIQRQNLSSQSVLDANVQALGIMNRMRDLPVPPGTDGMAFAKRKLLYAASAASYAIDQGAGILVTLIANTFPELANGPVTLPGIGKYDLGQDLKAHYGKRPDEPLLDVQDCLATIKQQYLASFDDGAGNVQTYSTDFQDKGFVISPDQIMDPKKGNVRT
jgi:hypothetical protein